MKITVLCVGKIRESFFADAVAEYKKRLGKYCRLEILAVADEQTPDHAPPALADMIKKKEGERLLRLLPDGAYVIALEIDGAVTDSVSFAKKIERLGVEGVSHIVFIIGGSLGLHTEVSRRADYALSFSRMTFPHQLMRVILLEQIYRAFRIMKGEPYHK